MANTAPARTRKLPSMADVAAHAGVSSQTVSRVSNGAPNVGDGTRRRVLDAMRAVGYRPNGAARALKYGRFGAIGVVAYSMTRFGESHIIDGIAESAREAGYSINLLDMESPTQDNIRRAVAGLTSQAVDGLVIVKAEELDVASLAIPPELPVVVTDGTDPGPHAVVAFDQARGVALAVRHLLDLGHATVHHVAALATSAPARQRTAAWQQELRGAGRPVPDFRSGDWTSQWGYAAGRELCARPDVTAVFCSSDQIALGFLLAAHEAGLRVPHDVSVVGFDGMPESAYFWPPLTTVDQDFRRFGEICMRVLLQRLTDHGMTPPPTEIVPVDLLVRGSTAPPSPSRSGQVDRTTDRAEPRRSPSHR